MTMCWLFCRLTTPLHLTLGLGRVVVNLTEQLPVLHQVELVPGVQFPRAHQAREAVHVVNIILGSANYGTGGDTFTTPGALRAVFPGH